MLFTCSNSAASVASERSDARLELRVFPRSFSSSHLVPIGCGFFLTFLGMVLQLDAANGVADLSKSYDTTIHPWMKEYCLGCHSTEKHKGDLDLERFHSLDEILKSPKVWQTVLEQVSLGEMPPKEKPQPTSEQRSRFIGWVGDTLDEMARARAGDPGPVVLRRLNNAEYTYTLQDLTGVDSLQPAKEFPADSGAGEGFMNTGNTLVMSPALLTKYLDAAKELSTHAVLLPDGFRFSSSTMRRDWTEELLSQIRGIYRRYADSRGADKVNLQGIVFDTNEGGRLPLDRYVLATLELRDRPEVKTAKHRASAVAPEVFDSLGKREGLSPKYLSALWELLNSTETHPQLLLDPIRNRWSTLGTNDVAAWVGDVARWQKALWKFSSVGHIGKVGGPKAWMEPVNPVQSKFEVRYKLSAPSNSNEVVVYLVAGDAGDGAAGDYVVWQQPRLVAPGRPNLYLKDLRDFAHEMSARRERVFASTAACLGAAAEAISANREIDVDALAKRHQVEPIALRAWLDYLGIGSSSELHLDYFTQQIHKASNYDFINGWGSPETPNLFANASDQHVRIPGNMKPHAVALHPSPKLNAAIGWRSPMRGAVQVEAKITHAHPECGNGVTWSVELRHGPTRQRLANGFSQGGKPVNVGTLENVFVQPGDLISILIGPRDGNHSCDLTDVDWTVRSQADPSKVWNLSRDVSADVTASNPHRDSLGNEGVWHFYTEPVSGGETGPVIPAGSLLARWQSAEKSSDKGALGNSIQELLNSGGRSATNKADADLYRLLASLGGPLFAGAREVHATPSATAAGAESKASRSRKGKEPVWGLDPALFGKSPKSGGAPLDGNSICVQAPSVLEIHLPADLVAGFELVTTGILEPKLGKEGSVQLQASAARPGWATAGKDGKAHARASSDSLRRLLDAPIIANEDSEARKKILSDFDAFRSWFPAALAYVKIVPVDEVITLILFHREDGPLCRLMLSASEIARLDRLWEELRFVSRDALTVPDAYEQLWQYATQDADPKVFEPLRKPIYERAAAFRQTLTNSEPRQLDALMEFASKAFRRPILPGEETELRSLYRKLRSEELNHEDAFRLTLAKVFVSPSFLYRFEKPASGDKSGPISDWELATRLSYFLWSSTPDAALREAAASGRLHQPEVMKAQVRRMLADPKIRRLAKEFACQWLHIYDFDALDEKSERHFPEFAAMRNPMYEEAIQFFTDAFQRDRSVLEWFDADHTFLNESLAKFYGIPGVKGDQWRRVDGVKNYARGGVLGLGATLAKQSGASRTSPILRGNWVCEVLLGDKLPRPPKDVPRLPEDEAAIQGLTVRQLVEKHSLDPRCAGCHRRIDAFGYVLEGFDAVGRARTKDLADRLVDTKAQLPDGSWVEGAQGLKTYLVTKKRDAVMKQFCKKFLGYALARAVQLSDQPLIAEMQKTMREQDYRLSAVVDTLIGSRQFREIRGEGFPSEE